MTVFPNGKHGDQVDSTAQFLDWFKRPMLNWGIFEYYRQRAQELEQRRKPQPTPTAWAPGCMEWQAEQVVDLGSLGAPKIGPRVDGT